VTAKYPSLYQVNTRATLRELGATSLDAIPDADLDRYVELGFDWVWFLGVWQTGHGARAISRSQYESCDADDVCGSCFAVTGYEVHSDFGADAAILRLRDRLHQRGLRLMVDFVPNHTAPDHPWVTAHPDYYMEGTEDDLARSPGRYARAGSRIFAYGRDPNFDGWPDTFQLNYANPHLQRAMRDALLRIAELADGVRCYMAILLLPEVFERTWGTRPEPFWPSAIQQVRERRPEFLFLAEVYWDLEWTMQRQGFDYAYDKRLYDRLREGKAAPIRDHLRAPLDYQGRLARFIENHDEPRAAATFAEPMHRAAAMICFCAPGLRFFHQGQMEGWRQHLSVHLSRRTPEPLNDALGAFYRGLLAMLPQGQWAMLDPQPAWPGNWTHDNFIVYSWTGVLIAVNYSDIRSQCIVRADADEMRFDLEPWGFQVLQRPTALPTAG